jgi:hypothetical protein
MMEKVVILFGFCVSIHAQIVLTHSGLTDPRTEGWTRFPTSPSGGVSEGPINDGEDAWQISDQSNVGTLFYKYNGPVNTPWSLDVRVKTAANDTQNAGSPGAAVGSFYMFFGALADGTPTVTLPSGGNGLPGDVFPGGTTFTLTGAGSGYHEYLLSSNPGGQSASLYVDGQLMTSSYAGATLSPPAAVWWGAAMASDIGAANFASVTFTTVPEPTPIYAALGVAVFSVGFIIKRHAAVKALTLQKRVAANRTTV